ncbi:hypothetical protein CISIN_1g0383972mg, partial [Citrus sinensis]
GLGFKTSMLTSVTIRYQPKVVEN